jgi:BirA family biotin operon repressor/biotin-[acetyl-CoA-carboxylase] ligase
VVIGIGVNLSVPSFPPDVAGVSLHELTGDPPSAAALLTALLPELSDRLDRLARGGVPGLRTEWMSHAAGIGAAVTATSMTGTVTGIAEGVDNDGALLLRTGDGLVRVLAGDVHIGLRPPG